MVYIFQYDKKIVFLTVGDFFFEELKSAIKKSLISESVIKNPLNQKLLLSSKMKKYLD